MKSYTAIILARKGSVRIPGKNMVLLRGRPLVEWSILAATLCPYVENVIVSTDWDAVANVALDHGCIVIKRPPELSGPDVDSYEPLKHAIYTIGMVENLVLLQPTSPTRNAVALSYFIAGVDSTNGACVSVNPGENFPNGAMYAASGSDILQGFKWESPYSFRLLPGAYFTDVDYPEDLAIAEQEMIGQRGPLLSWE